MVLVILHAKTGNIICDPSISASKGSPVASMIVRNLTWSDSTGMRFQANSPRLARELKAVFQFLPKGVVENSPVQNYYVWKNGICSDVNRLLSQVPVVYI